MPKCVLCDSQSFDILDGLFFCTDCGTQSQDVREELREETFDDNNRRLKVEKGRPKKKKDIDLGKPWFSIEGFQILIKKQVEYLIQIGVNPKLKDVVGHLWFRYVQLSTNSFVTADDDQSPQSFVNFKRKRDDTKDFVAVDSIFRPMPSFLTGERQDLDALELSSEIAREEFYEDDDPTFGLFDEEANLSDKSDESDVGSVNTNTLTAKSRNAVTYMTFNHTLAFCYLGLLWLQEPICISDLIRWARNGHLPYGNASSYFPSHMKFSQEDVLTFSARSFPKKRSVYRHVRSLKLFLSLPDFPQQNLNVYVSRFVTDLQLPACIHRNVQSLVHLVKYRPSPVPVYDDLAIAYIILSLKLVYGLNGKTEFELAKLAVDIPDEDNSSYVPTWGDLFDMITTCQSSWAKRDIPQTMEEFENIEDGRNYAEFCHEKLFGSWQPPYAVNRYIRFLSGQKGLNLEKRQEYVKMFEMFFKKDSMNEEHIPTSFPLSRGKVAWLRDHTRGTCGWSADCGGKSADQAESADQMACSVVNNPFRQVRKQGIPMEMVTRYHQSGIPAPQNLQPSENELSQARDDLQPPQGHRERISDPQGNCQVPDEVHPEVAHNLQPPDYVSYNMPASYYLHNAAMQFYVEQWANAVLPNSLKQLVEVCSKIVEAEPMVLYSHLQVLERNVDG